MNKKDWTTVIIALICCFLLGCGAAAAMRYMDAREITPIQGGKTITLPAFSIDVPQDAVLHDHTEDNHQLGETAVYAGSIVCSLGDMNIFIYENEAGDNIADYGDLDLVRYYMNAGGTQVRIRDLGGRRFICYRASVMTEEGAQLWDAYETWDNLQHIVVETRIDPIHALPMMASAAFSSTAE